MARMTKQQPVVYLYGLVLGNRARVEYTEDGIVVSGVISVDPYCEPDWWFIPRQLDLPRVVIALQEV